MDKLSEKLSVKIALLDHFKDLPLPEYQTRGAAGFDFRAAIDEAITIKSLERALIPTGIQMAVPEGFELQVRPRSGLAIKNGITVLNSPGTVDSDYRGEIAIILINLGSEDFVVEPGLRIAQGVFARCYQAGFEVLAELDETSRGSGGFGHTGNF